VGAAHRPQNAAARPYSSAIGVRQGGRQVVAWCAYQDALVFPLLVWVVDELGQQIEGLLAGRGGVAEGEGLTDQGEFHAGFTGSCSKGRGSKGR